MQLSQSTSMRQEMRQLLTPRMIQSMEILQLPLMALEERIEQELENNPVLELKESEAEGPDSADADGSADAPDSMIPDAGIERPDRSEDEQPMVVREDRDSDDFERLAKLGEYLEN